MFSILKISPDYDLTVVIVTYNHKERIKRCLDSVLNQQTSYRYKVIIADDSSTDGTSEICAEYAEKFKNVKHVRRPENVGVLANAYPVFCGIDTEFWTALDGDDYWCDEEKIQLCIDSLKQHPDCVGVTHQVEIESVDGRLLYTTEADKNKIEGNIISFVKNYVNFNHTPTSSRLYRNILDFSKMPMAAIWDIWLWTIFLSKGDFFYIDRVMSCYDVLPHQSVYQNIVRYGTYEDKMFLAKKTRLSFAQLSKYLEWRYDDQIRQKCGLRKKHKNNMKNWIEYINGIKPFDRRGWKFKLIETISSLLGLKLMKNEIKTQSVNKKAKIVNTFSSLLGIRSPFEIREKRILAIYGSGGFGREVYDIAVRRNKATPCWSDIVFIDDFRDEEAFNGTQSYHFDTLAPKAASYEIVIAVGEPSARETLFDKVKSAGFSLATLIDPTALISPSAEIGEGTIVCEFVSVHCNVIIGNNCVIQPYCDIGHDIIVGGSSVFSPHFAPGGHSVFGNKVYCGMASSAKEGLTFGDNAVVAMGAAVFRDVPENCVVVGNPARVTRGNDEGKVFK